MEEEDEPSSVFYSNGSDSDLEFRDLGEDGKFTVRPKKRKKVTRTDIIYDELVGNPLKGSTHPVMVTSHRYALCEYCVVVPLILAAIGGFYYLLGYLYERLFFDELSTAYYYLLYEGWIAILMFCSLTLGIKACQVGLNVYCCRKR